MMRSDRRSTYLLVESIGCWDGVCPYLPLHQQRLERSMEELFPSAKAHKLSSILADTELPIGVNKIRFLYNERNYHIEVLPYERREIQQLQIVKRDDISYPYKYAQRPELDKLYEKRGKADEILIFKNGLLTDAYYANVVCALGGRLCTPATPLLEGVMREYLIREKKVDLLDIDLASLRSSKGVFLVNALNPMETAPYIPAESILID